tara:strand:- start:220 stop:549 length:330 start_codon:yes stop_codon:yes gene_type:complete
VLNKGGNMNNKTGMSKSSMEFRNDLSKSLTMANRVLMNVFIYSQMMCVILVLLLSHHDYTYLTNAGHVFLESILVFFTWISVITIVGNLMIRAWRKIFKLQSNQCSIWL